MFFSIQVHRIPYCGIAVGNNIHLKDSPPPTNEGRGHCHRLDRSEDGTKINLGAATMADTRKRFRHSVFNAAPNDLDFSLFRGGVQQGGELAETAFLVLRQEPFGPGHIFTIDVDDGSGRHEFPHPQQQTVDDGLVDILIDRIPALCTDALQFERVFIEREFVDQRDFPALDTSLLMLDERCSALVLIDKLVERRKLLRHRNGHSDSPIATLGYRPWASRFPVCFRATRTQCREFRARLTLSGAGSAHCNLTLHSTQKLHAVAIFGQRADRNSARLHCAVELRHVHMPHEHGARPVLMD